VDVLLGGYRKENPCAIIVCTWIWHIPIGSELILVRLKHQ
jgi:hypothetical protein